MRGMRVSSSCRERHANARLRVVIVFSPSATAPASMSSLSVGGGKVKLMGGHQEADENNKKDGSPISN